MRRRSDYHYPLPPELIAQTPAGHRDDSRLLVAGDGDLADHHFRDVVHLIPENAVLVVNNTRVFPARLRAAKESGGAVELLFLDPALEPAETAAITGPRERWRCMAKSSKALKPGMRLMVAGGDPDTSITVVTGRAEDSTIMVEVAGTALELLDEHGEIPLPPYIQRPDGTTGQDAERYQTVYARHPGAVAAPTAGLHFTPALLEALGARGVTTAEVTLHVGMGTFAPVRVDDLREHRMHKERYGISADSAAAINQALEQGRPVVAVGTTCVRALESAARRQPDTETEAQTEAQQTTAATQARPVQIPPGPATTDLFIRPGFDFRVVSHLITNFHLPESTLLMLVCAFSGYDRIMTAYRHAVGAGYRFFSYGDAMLLTRQSP